MGSPRAQSSALFYLLFIYSSLVLFSGNNISFHFYADDCTIYVPLTQNNARSVQPLIDCLDDNKAWLSLNYFSLNENKTEVMVFGPSCCSVPNADLGSLSLYFRDCVTNLGVEFDSDFKFDKQISTVVQKSFYQLHQIPKIRLKLRGDRLFFRGCSQALERTAF